MKRTTLFVTLALILALSAGAAAQVSLSGWVEFDVGIRQKVEKNDDGVYELVDAWELYGRARRFAQLRFTASKKSGSVDLAVGFGNQNAGADGAGAWVEFKDGINANANVQLALNTLRLTAKGPLWEGGQPVEVIAGQPHTANYSTWVAAGGQAMRGDNSNNRQAATRAALEIRNIKAGPFTIHALAGHSTPYSNWGQDSPIFVTASGDLGGITTKVTVADRDIKGNVTNGNTILRRRVRDIAVEASTKLIDGVELSGAFVIDGQGQGRAGATNATLNDELEPKTAWRADATVTTVPSVKLTGSIWQTEDGFAPRYARWETSDGGWYYEFTTNRQGFKVGAETSQAGVDLTGSYENVSNVSGTDYNKTVTAAGAKTKVENFDVSVDVTLTKETGKDDVTKTVLGLGTKLGSVDLKYTGTIETDKDVKNEIVADTTQNLFFARNVKINGAVILQGENVDYGVDATWNAPNGLQVVAGYATYKKSNQHFVHQKSVHDNQDVPDGFYIRTFTRLTF